MPLELVCHACNVTLHADTEEELAALAEQHAPQPPRARASLRTRACRIRHHNR